MLATARWPLVPWSFSRAAPIDEDRTRRWLYRTRTNDPLSVPCGVAMVQK
jgi:hypothetical protein